MKALTISTLLLFISVNFCIAQDLGILRTTVYKKINNNWSLSSKYEYSKDHLIEKKTGYEWAENSWQIGDEWIRTFSANMDTIVLVFNSREGMEMTQVYKQICYNVRDQQNSIVDVIADRRSIKNSQMYSDEQVDIDLTQECLPTNYPYDEVFRKAEIIKNEDISLEGKKIEIDFCGLLEFVLSGDEYNRIKSFESETTKIVVTYRENGNLTPNFKNIFMVYPNPFHEVLEIDLFTNAAKVEILNSFGSEVYASRVEGENKISLNLADIPAGLYCVNVYSEGKVYTQKIIKI